MGETVQKIELPKMKKLEKERYIKNFGRQRAEQIA